MIATWAVRILHLIHQWIPIYPEDWLRMLVCFSLGLWLALPWGIAYFIWKRRAKKYQNTLLVAGQFSPEKCREYVTYYASHRL